MAAFVKAVRIAKTINNATKLLNNCAFPSNGFAKSSPLCSIQRITTCPAAYFHATSKRLDLMEFFDEKKHWGASEVKVGRSWKMDELRIKSNEDLHKLWFVLLKERNMLFTMEEACKENWQVFPNPERIDKILNSMKNLEKVVRERNNAYHMLERGETAERPQKMVYNQLGLKEIHRMNQHRVPKFANAKWRKEHVFSFGGYAVAKFRRLYNEKLWNIKRRERNRNVNHARKLIDKFPDMDFEALQSKYPDVDVDKLRQRPRRRGHYVP